MMTLMDLCWGEPLAHRAVISSDQEVLEDVQKTAEPLLRMANGWQFDPVELAQYLEKQDALSVINPDNLRTFRVLLQGEKNFKTIDQQALEKTLGFHYWPHLHFKDYDVLKITIRQCPYLFRSVLFGDQNLELGLQYRSEIKRGYVVNSSIRWIDDQLEYGLFAEENIDKGRFVGEYTGKVRPLSRLFPDHNAYCFHYPTKFWSWNYHVIDSKEVGNELRFVNHSDAPNLEPMWLVDRGLLHLAFKAKKPIRKGTQLTFDYGPDYWKKREKVVI